MKRGRNSNDDIGPKKQQHARKGNANNNRNARRFALRVQILELERLVAAATTLAEQRRLLAHINALRHALHALG